MKTNRRRRAGATQTFSVSVDPETKRALRKLANSDYAGNLSALVTAFAQDARRRMAAGAYLRRHGIAALTAAEVRKLEAEIEHDITTWKKRRRGRQVA
jgi:hypothetical protein